MRQIHVRTFFRCQDFRKILPLTVGPGHGEIIQLLSLDLDKGKLVHASCHNMPHSARTKRFGNFRHCKE